MYQYQIALCDDECMELNKLENILYAYQADHPQYSYTILSFENAEVLLCKIRQENYMPDILFLDIYMPGKLGTQVSKELREMGVKSRIIFLTTSTEYALEAFRVDATQYIVKPARESELADFLDRLFEELDRERKKYVLLPTDDGICRIPVQDIVCCESQRKSQYVYVTDDSRITLHMTMSGVEELLDGFTEFVRAGSSYIVNLAHIESMGRQELLMDDGRIVYLPRGSYPLIKEKYFSYYSDTGP